MKLIILIIIFCISKQITYTDEISKVEFNEVEIYLDSSLYYIHSNFNKSFDLANKALILSLNQNDNNLVTKSLMIKGRILTLNNFLDEGRNHLLKSLNNLNQDNKSLKAEIYDNLGLNLRINYNFDDAKKYYNYSLKIRTELADTSGIINIYTNFACIQRDLYTFSKRTSKTSIDSAIYYINRSYELAEKINDKSKLIETYLIKSEIMWYLNKLDSAISLLRKFMVFEEQFYGEVSTNNYARISELYAQKGDRELSKKYIDSTLKNFDDNLTIDKKINIFADLATTYRYLNNYKLALNYYDSILFYEKIKAKRDAYDKISRYLAIQDDQLMQDTISQLKEFNTLKEFKIKSKNLLIGVLITTFLLILILLIKIYSQKRSLDKNLLIINEKNYKVNQSIVVKEKLFSVLAHDIKNSLIGIRMMVENILGFNKTNLEESNMKEIHSTNNHVISLLDNLLEWIKVQTGNIIISQRAIKPCSLVNEIIELNKVMIHWKDLNIVNNVNSTISFTFDERMLYSILHNLIGNSIKYTDEGSIITIESIVKGGNTEIIIEDNGPGMADSLVDEFNKDYKTQVGTKGLGLQICKEFSKLNNAKLLLLSKPDIGTKFTLIIPVNRNE